jgi:glyoxylase-like metal-dependent hydrolase (beta-lactamase superfamily II)
MAPTIKEFFDIETWTLTYVIYDLITKDAIVIDPVWNYDPSTSKLSTTSVDKVQAFINSHALKVHYILETHAHADHVSGSQVLKKKIPEAKIGAGINIKDVQKVFSRIFNLGSDFKPDGSQFDFLLSQDQELYAGTLKILTLPTPGHTPACVSYVIGDAVFTGDALFMPDYGTGRCDFPGGSAEQLYVSIYEKLYSLPDQTRVFVGHDYLPNGRALAFESTIGMQKKTNIHLNMKTTKEEFVEFRNSRDASLTSPRLLFQSLQINIRAGSLPESENNGAHYLKIPIRQ